MATMITSLASAKIGVWLFVNVQCCEGISSLNWCIRTWGSGDSNENNYFLALHIFPKLLSLFSSREYLYTYFHWCLKGDVISRNMTRRNETLDVLMMLTCCFEEYVVGSRYIPWPSSEVLELLSASSYFHSPVLAKDYSMYPLLP